MICPKCSSENVLTHVVTDVKTKHRGCIGWCLWILLAICTFGLILIIPLLTNSSIKSNQKTMAICQNCGYTWEIIPPKKKIPKIVWKILLWGFLTLVAIGLLSSLIQGIANLH
jgi:uncharacterized Zn finger protein